MSEPTLSRDWERWQALWRRAGNASAVAVRLLALPSSLPRPRSDTRGIRSRRPWDSWSA